MENFARVVFTIIFITILAGAIVFFALFSIAPAEKIVRALKGGPATSTERVSIDQSALSALKELFAPSSERETSALEEKPATPPPGAGPSGPALGTPENPYQSAPVAEKEIPNDFLKMTVSAEGFSPSRFAVPAGGLVGISLTSGDHTHVFKFEDPSLKKAVVGLGPDETRLIEFYAPKEKGEYVFYCDVAGHRARGEEGVMVVE
ncbi:MAG: cupredoxin domain-containing protein [Candidatus Brennerbacteria bacterium]|nr:cupredoxin domain-containing protein [Candidatus Brennerbacteria bacterium]